MNDNLSSQARPFVCCASGCSKAFVLKCHLTRHTLIHAGLKPFTCDSLGCNAAFNQPGNLATHKKRMHDNIRPFICDAESCNAAFKILGDLAKHKRTHEGLRPYVCDVVGCDKTFTKMETLTDHKHAHDNIRPYACGVDECKAAFVRLGGLKDHMRSVHTEYRPFVCTVNGCGKAFAWSGHLAVHMRIHDGARPFICDFDGCGLSFTQSGNLVQHKRTHDGSKPYVCMVTGCDYAFARSDNLALHSHHYHTPEGQGERKREEVKVKKALDTDGLDYKREHHIDHACAIDSTTFARMDFMLTFRNTAVFLEVDEGQHNGYGVSCDVTRMAKTVESLRVAGNTMRVAFIRYNPHAFTVDGVKRRRPTVLRLKQLIEVLKGFGNDSTDDEDIRVFYMYYSTNGDKPAIFDDPEYPDIAKEWLARVYV